MAIEMTDCWVTVNTENPDYWSDQSYTIRYSTIESVRLVKAIVKPNGPDNGLEIKTERDRFWMRYQDFAKAEADYKSLIATLMDIGD